MSGRRRMDGFTLVELLVVISIIGMLMALLLPAVQSAREAGRRNTCANNARQAALAMINYETAKRYYPGYANLVNASGSINNQGNVTNVNNTYLTSYVVPILPYMERNDVYRTYTDPTQSASSVYMAILVCPSNPPTAFGGPALAYVVNSGYDAQTTGATPLTLGGENPADGVCFNAAASAMTATSNNVRVGQDYVDANDGCTNTLLLTENNQAQLWTLMGTVTTFMWATATPNTNGNVSGLVAKYMKPQNSFSWFNITTLPNAATYRINANKTTPPSGAVSSIGFARPSSNHTGGVNATFCDGHLKFLAEDVNYTVLRQLMTSNYIVATGYSSDFVTNSTTGAMAPPAGSTTSYHELPLDDTMY